MANAQSVKEVMDSEDEPLSSSPINTSDVAANKFSTSTHASSKEPEDAPQEAAHTHQAVTQDTVDLNHEQSNGLAANQQNATRDNQPSPLNLTNTQLDIATREGDTTFAKYNTGPISELGQEGSQTAEQKHASPAISEPPASISSTTDAVMANDERSASSRANMERDVIGEGNCHYTSAETKGTEEEATILRPKDHSIPIGQGPSPSTLDSDHLGRKEDRSGAAPEGAKDPSSSTAHDTKPTDASNTCISRHSAALDIDNSSGVPPTSTAESTTNGIPAMATNSHTTSTQSAFESQTSTPDQPSQTAAQPVVPKTPQEITLAELKAQRAALLASLAALPAVQVLIEENAASETEMADDDEPTEKDIMAAANKMVKEHIKLLHEYNELKDVGQGLMGLIADQRGVRIVEVQEEFGVDGND